MCFVKSTIHFCFVFRKAQGSKRNIVGVIITAEAIWAECNSRVINPEVSRTYCTMYPVLNLTVSPRPNTKDWGFPKSLWNIINEPASFALKVAIKITATIIG